MRAVNLIPAEQRGGQSVGAGRSQGGAYAVLALIAGLAAIAYAYGHAAHQVESRQAQVDSLDAQAQQTQQSAERLAPYTSFMQAREARTQAVENLIDSRFDWAHAFHEFGRVLPGGVSVSSLTGTIGAGAPGATVTAPAAASAAGTSAAAGAASGSSAESATPSGSVPTFTISGCATGQRTVALTLERLRLIDGVKEVTLQSSTAGSAGSGAAGGCTPQDPVFSATVVFEALPSAAAIASATQAHAKTVADSSVAGGGATGAKQGSAR
ncbi:MAG TPA: hypothetical protein VL979_11420 [Solirubrobacteraceae bacterium]|nr:hypothetical protein [Solirubrobacteraceae bacterium]